jgi:hypothetical protein
VHHEHGTIGWLETGVARRSRDPAARLILVFELFHEWFQSPDFEASPIITALLESVSKSVIDEPVTPNRTRIRALVTDLAAQAGIKDAKNFGTAWHMLMEGSIVSAYAGNRSAALEAKRAATVLLDAWPRTVKTKKAKVPKP